MDDTSAILDYAGPRKRSVLRLPAVSRLSVDATEGRVAVVESLAGQSKARGAIAFGFVVLAVQVLTTIPAVYDFRHHHLHRYWEGTALLPALLAVAIVATMAGVVQQTWRQTRLSAEYDELRLSFTSPLHRRHYRWTGAQIADVVLVLTANVETAIPLGEVLITRATGGEIRLFTDHAAGRLGPIARVVHDVLREGRADPIPPTEAIEYHAAASAEPAVPPDLAPRAEQTAGRLLDVRRAMRADRTEFPKQSPAAPPRVPPTG